MAKDNRRHKDIIGEDIERSTSDEWDKRVIRGKIVNVTYHAIDWAKCFGGKKSE